MTRARWAAIVAFFAVLAIGSTYPLSVHPAGLIYANADALAFAWAMAWNAHQLPRAPLSLAQANIFHPDPASLTYGEPMIAQGLIGLPVYALSGNDVLTFNIVLLATLVLSALGAFLLAVELTGNVAASVLAGLVFTFTTANYDSIPRLQVVSAQWTPLALFFLVRLLRGASRWDAAGLGIALGLQGLSSQYYKLYLITLLVLTAPLFLLALPPSRRPRIPWRGLAMSAAIFLAMTLPTDLVQWRQLRAANTERAARMGAPPTSYRRALPENWLYGHREDPVVAVSFDDRYFTGVLPPVLAIVGAVALIKPLRRRLGLSSLPPSARAWPALLGLGLLAFLLGCGKVLPVPWVGPLPGPYLLLFDFVPGFNLTRVPSRFAMFVRLVMALLVAAGGAALLERLGRRARWILLALLGVALPLEHQSTPLPAWTVSTGARVPSVYRWLAEKGNSGAILEFPPYPVRIKRLEATWMHFSTVHWHPLVNGFGANYPAFYDLVIDELLGGQPGLPSFPALRMLKRLKVEYLIVHPAPRGQPESDHAYETFERRLENFANQLRLVKSFEEPVRIEGNGVPVGPTRVFRLVGKPLDSVAAPAWTELPREGWSCEAVPATTDCALAFDGNLGTAYQTRRFQRGGESLRITWPRAVAVVGAGLVSGRYSSDYPREVHLRGRVGSVWRPLDRTDLRLLFLDELLRDPLRAALRFDFGAPVALDGIEFVLRAEYPARGWSVAEVELYGESLSRNTTTGRDRN
jgi:hypothetical protein